MRKNIQHRLIVDGDYETVEEAKNALQMPFIEDRVEEEGRFRLHDLDRIRAASGIALGDLEIGRLGDGRFEIACRGSGLVLNRRRAEELAEKLRFYDIFDEVSIEEID